MPWSGVTAEKTFSWLGFCFSFWRQSTLKAGSSASSQQTCHNGSNHSLCSAALCTKPGSPVMQKAKPSSINWGSITSLLLLCAKSVAPAQTQPPTCRSFQHLNPFFPLCPVGSQGYETIAHLETQAADLYFWQPKGKVRPACRRHIKFRLIGTLQSPEQKRDFE